MTIWLATFCWSDVLLRNGVMAENETLDLFYRSSGRWRNVWRLLASGTEVERVAEELVRNLYRTFKNLIKEELIQLEALCDAATGRRDDLELLERQAKAAEYAQLFSRNAYQQLSRVQVVENVLLQTIDRFVDQIEHELIGKDRYPDIPSFAYTRDRIANIVAPHVSVLAETLARSPNQPPRMPPLTIERRRQQSAELLNMSVLTH
jgi:hypothetical protein